MSGRGRPSTPAVERFWARVNGHGPVPEFRPDLGPCWLWTGKPDDKGYGRLRPVSGGPLMKAHRFAYALLVGPIPEGYDLDHLCRVRACVNPKHLEPVTNRENVLRGKVLITRCKSGHLLSGDNVYRSPTEPNKRRCRHCRAERHRRTYVARVAA